MSPSTSHDPKTDSRSLVILLAIAVVACIGLAGYLGAFKPVSTAPKKLYTIDGCDVYRFVDENETGYFARCQNGNASTTVKAKHVLTTPKPAPVAKPAPAKVKRPPTVTISK